ncbi:MAG: VOC family protein [Dehalococcoidia bacterium]
MIKLKRLGHLVLRVRDVKRSEEFYSNVLGLEVKGRYDDRMVFFRSNQEVDHDLAILGIGDDAPGPEATRVGLYHFAYELGSFEELREAYGIIKEKGVRIAGFGDHGDTKGLYLLDPDGNEVELYAIAPQHESTPLEELLTEPQASRAG